ncbi:hypothetical protein BD626DRAFT_492746 [Schizophyllum amplum]|uniref:C2H2-type domain-containing protein n=1 Tax=Schizophyllum amplum TaxID=97359 RepID=A0A550CG72_9AGAR|nr:hypothetical protein BD626DRAFT_492746 [Auriculariopsis ampla]
MPATRTAQNPYTKDNLPSFRKNVCEACGASVRAKRDQERHARGHLPEDTLEHITMKKPFKCEWDGCTKRFSQKSTLIVHVAAIHTGEKNYHCPDCPSSFADPSAWSRHRKRRHGWVSPKARGPRRSNVYAPYAMPIGEDFEPKEQFPAHTAPPVMSSYMPGYAYDIAGPAAAPDYFVDPRTPSLSSSSSPASSSSIPSPMGMQMPHPWDLAAPFHASYASYEEYPAIEQMLNHLWSGQPQQWAINAPLF